MGKAYNKLDKFFKGWLPGGIPRGGDDKDVQKSGDNPDNTANQVATTAGDSKKNNNGEGSETIKKRKVTFQSLSYPEGIAADSEEFPHQILFNVLVRDHDDAGGNYAGLPEAGRGEQLWDSTNLTNENAQATVKDVASVTGAAGLITAGLAKGGLGGYLTAILGGVEGYTQWFGDKVSDMIDIKTTRRNVARIHMAMPTSPQNKMIADWQHADMGAIIGASLGAAGEDGLMNLIDNGTLTGEAGEYALRAATGAFNITKQFGANLPLQEAIQLGTRKIANPFKETLFKTMQFRDFPFVFKFAPKNQHELLQTMKIINVFERYMTPERRGNLFLDYPAEFEIVYMYKGRENLYFTNFFNDTALTSFQVDYGNGGVYSSIRGTDGAPSEITMSLVFKELTLLHRDAIVDVTNQEEVMGGFDRTAMNLSGATISGTTPDAQLTNDAGEEVKTNEDGTVADGEEGKAMGETTSADAADAQSGSGGNE